MPLKNISFGMLVRPRSLQGALEKFPPFPGDNAKLEISGSLITSTALEHVAVTDKLFIERDQRSERKATPGFAFGRRTNIFKNNRQVFPYLFLEGMTPADANSTKSTTTRPQG